ncbi:MAG: hypothetical protein AB3K77_13385 [Methanosarcinaceae archaeon]
MNLRTAFLGGCYRLVMPEIAEIDLSKYQGKALIVLVRDGDGWIYSAEVVDQVGPILAAVVQKLFSQ